MFIFLYIYVDREGKADKIGIGSQKLAHLHRVGSRELVFLSGEGREKDEGENQDSALETQGQHLHSDWSAHLQTQSER